MKILLSGANGYVGIKLLPILLKSGHDVVCSVRNPSQFNQQQPLSREVEVIQTDFLDEDSLKNIPSDIDAAFYLIHSMSSSADYMKLERQSAINFRNALEKTQVKHCVYLGGIANERELSKHLASRKNVEHELKQGHYHFTALRAGIIIGSGSASFEIIRDLVEKLPIMIAPKWLMTKCQPISITDVVQFLSKTLLDERTYDADFDIGCRDVLTYKDMLLEFASVRGLSRRIKIVPVMTPRISSYWLYFMTSTSYKLAVALVNSMKVEVVCRDDRINRICNITPMDYRSALEKTLIMNQNEQSESSSMSVTDEQQSQESHDQITPIHGCYVDRHQRQCHDPSHTLEKIWNLGGKNDWCFGNMFWRLRGYLDSCCGGVGLRSGRTHEEMLQPGHLIDFWKVLYANKSEKRLVLIAEMKLPGEAWLEFKIEENNLFLISTFRPLGLKGRAYWFLSLPFHSFVFNKMIKSIC